MRRCSSIQRHPSQGLAVFAAAFGTGSSTVLQPNATPISRLRALRSDRARLSGQ
jgi:hypothetical protein